MNRFLRAYLRHPMMNADGTGGGADSASDSGAGQQQPQAQPAPTTETKPLNYEDLYSQDKALQSFVDKAVTKATQSAVQNALDKERRLRDEKLSEAERLKGLDAERRAEEALKLLDAERKARIRDKEIESLKAETVTKLSEKNIPDMFLNVFSFDGATAEDVQARIDMLAEYEYYPKGELDKRIATALNEKLKQKTPETHGNSGASSYTLADIGKMTPEQINKNWETISKSLGGK